MSVAITGLMTSAIHTRSVPYAGSSSNRGRTCCLERRNVVHLEQYRNFLQDSDPLDRLSNADYMEIMWGDAARLVLRGLITTCLEEERPVLREPPHCTGWKSIPSPRSWGSGETSRASPSRLMVTRTVTGTTCSNRSSTGPPSLRCGSCAGGITHQCRPVSYNRTRLPYLWGVRMLRYIDGTGWTFLEPGA